MGIQNYLQGAKGDPGPAGKSIANTSINNGRLIITFTDNSTLDVGNIVGAAGVDGRGIKGFIISNGNLIVTYSDDTVANLGSIIGPPGATGPAGIVAGDISFISRTANSQVLTLGLLAVGNQVLTLPLMPVDAHGRSPQAGDFCSVAVASGSSMPTGVTIMGPALVLSSGKISLQVSSTLTLTALQSGTVNVNVTW